MLDQFLHFINKNKLFQPKESILLAVSGGMDSVVMAELFHQAKFKFAIAHCNFQLRGKESDGDEKFVKDLAKKYGVKFFSIRFDTELQAKKNKVSIQMAARDLRYKWFKKIIKNEKYNYLATAHHLNDSIETFFINLLRGTGIEGITGIQQEAYSNTIRPLLFAGRSSIESFANENKIAFREDSSNSSDHYLRNKIRHHLIPFLISLNPSFEQTMRSNMVNFAFAKSIFASQDHYLREKYIKTEEKPFLFININQLKEHDYPEQLLYHLASPFSFTFTQCVEMIEENNATKSGKIFLTEHFRALRDRGRLIFDFGFIPNNKEYKITKSTKEVDMDVDLISFSFKSSRVSENIPSSNAYQWLDTDTLKFPLTIRRWKEGDYFYPLGMKKPKKLSDFFIDIKLHLFEKERTYVLTSENKIVCILGHRIDDRFKVTAKTKKIYKVEMK